MGFRGWVFGRLRSERPARVGSRAYTQRVTGEVRFRGVSSERSATVGFLGCASEAVLIPVAIRKPLPPGGVIID